MATVEIRNESAQDFMASLPDRSTQLIITDPPFGTGEKQLLASTQRSYKDPSVGEVMELIEDAILRHADRVLTDDGMVAILLDHRAVHHVAQCSELYMQQFGEIIWHFETGGASKKWWSNKHNTILLMSPRQRPHFDYSAVPTVERKAPVKGYTKPKKVTSVWTYTISTSDSQRVGYPSQKPLELYRRLIEVHSRPGDLVVDPFAGSGTVLEAAYLAGRHSKANDINQEAIDVMLKRARSLL